MHFILTIWLTAALSLMNALTIQDGTPVTESEYWERVRSTQQVAAGLEAEPEESVRRQLDALASEWEQVTEVQLSDGTVMPVDSSYLVRELRAEPPNLERLVSLLDALSRAHDEYPREVFTIQDIEPLQVILARPEFQWESEQGGESPAWLTSLLNAFARFMQGIVYGIQQIIYYGRVPLMITVVIIFLLSLYFISRNLTRNLVREAQLAAENGEGDEFLTSSSAMRRAQSLSNQGDYRNAIRYLYLSSLLVLDERGLLRYDRSRTNREYLRSISSKPELSQPLGDVIDVFDRVWYGYEDVDENTFQSYVEHVDELREKKE